MFWLIMLTLLLPTWAMAATYHVRTNGTAGSCVANTDTVAGSRNSIQLGVNCAGPGDTVMVHGGTYGSFSSNTTLNHVPGGSSSNRATLQAAPGELVWQNGSMAIGSFWVIEGINVDGGGVAYDTIFFGVNDISATFVRLQNMEIKRATHSGSLYGNNLEFINVNSHSHGIAPYGECANDPQNQAGQCHGLYLNESDYLVEGGEYHHNEGAGLHLHGSTAQRLTVRNVKVYDNAASGILMGQLGGSGRNAVSNTLSYRNAGGGLIKHTDFFNNTIYGNDSNGLWGTLNSVVRNNILYNTGTALENDAGGNSFSNNLCNATGGGCTIQGNPQFANADGGDFHLRNTSAAINAGTIAGAPSTDIEGLPRPEPGGSTYDIGAYECQNIAGADCASEPPPPPVNGLVAEYKESVSDTSGNGFNALPQGGLLFNGAPLTSVNTASFVFDGINDAVNAPNDPAFRSASFCMVAWMSSTTLPTTEACRLMSVGTTSAMGWDNTGRMFGYINGGGPTVNGSVNILDGSTHLLGLSYDNTERILRVWFDNSNFDSLPVGAALAYSGSEILAMGGVTGRFCNARVNNFRYFDVACSPTGMQQIYREVPTIAPGSSSTHWRFYQADANEGTAIAGSGVDAANIVVARSGKVRQRWNVKRNGSTVIEHFFTECNLNGGAFSAIDNSCAARPVCIAADSVKNMGDATINLLPNDGFNFVAGRFVVDTLNTSFTTSLPDGGVTEWETGYAFNQSLADGDVVVCRLRTGAGDFGPSGYPAVLPEIIVNVPAGLAGGASMSGGTSQGGRRQ
jgi:hypothetical protein